MPVVIQRGLTTRSRFAQQVLVAGQREVEEKLAEVGRDAVRRANDKVRKLYDNNRTSRQTKAGAVKLLGSFSYEINKSPGPGLPATIRLTSSADERKVASLEYGSKPHTISAVNAPLLIFPVAPEIAPGENAFRAGRRKTRPLKTRKQGANLGGAFPLGRLGDVTAAKQVSHPGTREGRFMRDSLTAAVRAAYRKVTTNA